jgi:Na+/melibiose symporter-like transporter
VCYGIGWLVMLWYPLDEAKHREVLELIERRDRAQQEGKTLNISDPLTGRPLVSHL